MKRVGAALLGILFTTFYLYEISTGRLGDLYGTSAVHFESEPVLFMLMSIAYLVFPGYLFYVAFRKHEQN